jgi:hypothetical protein
MTIYFVVIGIIVVTGAFDSLVFSRKPKIGNIITISIGFILLFLLSSLKSVRVGNDTIVYKEAYEAIANQNWGSLSFNNFKIGYLLLNKIFSSLFHASFQVFLGGVYFLIYLPLAYVTYRRSPNSVVTILLFVFWSFLCFDLSGLRQGISISFSLLSFDSLYSGFENNDKKKRVYSYILSFIWFLLAVSMHPSALAFALMFFLFFIPFYSRFLLFILPILIICFLFSGQLFQTLYSIGSNVDYAPGSYGGGGLFLLYFFLVIFLSVLIYNISFLDGIDNKMLALDNRTPKLSKTLGAKKTEIGGSYFNGIMWSIIVAAFFQSFSPSNKIFPRFAYYFTIPMIIGIPLAINRIKSFWGKFLLYSCLLIFYGLYFYFFYLKPGELNMSPYSFYWE